MHHDFMEGNIVCSKIDGQVMTIKGVRRNPFDNTLSTYVVCDWIEQKGNQKMKSFHIDNLEFVSKGNTTPYNVDENIKSSIW